LSVDFFNNFFYRNCSLNRFF